MPAVAIKPKAKRSARSAESITTGALRLPLDQRIDLVLALKKSIEAEVESLATKAQEARTLFNQITDPEPF